jgi:hypothetical protein
MKPATTTSVAATAPPVVRPPAATPAELTYRTEMLPWPTDDGLLREVAELRAAFERGDDWTGTLAGTAFHAVRADEWLLCWTINESYPEQCGSGVVLNTAPPAYLASPELFEAQTADGSEQPSVIISTSIVSVHGTFFADAALFVISDSEQAAGADQAEESS